MYARIGLSEILNLLVNRDGKARRFAPPAVHGNRRIVHEDGVQFVQVSNPTGESWGGLPQESNFGPATESQLLPEHLNLPAIGGILMQVKGPAERRQA
jgi:hypothetical protein